MWDLKDLELKLLQQIQRIAKVNTALNLVRFMLLCLVAYNMTAQSHAQQIQQNTAFPPPGQSWVVEPIFDTTVQPQHFADPRALAPDNALPDGRVTTAESNIVEAWYSEPTTRYNHVALGDNIEGGSLKVKNEHGETYTFRLPSTEVFEDIAPHLADLDGDGELEVVTILSSLDYGASIAVFKLSGNAFIKLAQTPFYGTPNRWMNIAQIDRFTGAPLPEIAIVVTPHLDGILQFYRLEGESLRLVVSSQGYSNHILGSNELRLSTTADVDGNGTLDLIVPSFQRNELVVVGVRDKAFQQLSRIELPARVVTTILKRQFNGIDGFAVGLDNGQIFSAVLQ